MLVARWEGPSEKHSRILALCSKQNKLCAIREQMGNWTLGLNHWQPLVLKTMPFLMGQNPECAIPAVKEL